LGDDEVFDGLWVGDGVFDQFLIPSILEAVCELFDETTALFDFTQDVGSTAIAGEMTTLEVGLNFSRSKVLKIKGRLRTVCLRHVE